MGTEAVELLSRIATIEEAELSGASSAFDCWLEVLSLEPAHERARVEIARLAQWLGKWPQATAALEAAAPGDPRVVTAADVDDLWPKLEPRLQPDAAILLKASRGVKLERIVPFLTSWATG